MMTKKWGWLVFGILLLGLVMPILAQAEPSIRAERDVYPPMAQVKIFGTGFEPNTIFRIYFYKPDETTDEYKLKTDGNGEFTYLYSKTDVLGWYGVAVTTEQGDGLAKCEFTVKEDAPIPTRLTCIEEKSGPWWGIKPGETVVYVVRLEYQRFWDDGKWCPLENEEIQFQLDDVWTDSRETDRDGIAGTEYDTSSLKPGIHTAMADYKGSEKYAPCSIDHTLTVGNTPPTLTCPGDQKVDEGTPLSGLSGTFVDPDDDKWEGGIDWGDGNWDEIKIDPDKKLFFLPDHTYVDNGVYKARVIIKDGYDGGECTFTVTVNNVPPKLTCPGDQKVDEGTALSGLSGSFTDPGDDKWEGRVDWGEGAGFVDEIKIDPIEKTFTLPNHTYADNGEYTATVRIKDGEGGGDCTFTVTVNNVDPTITAVTNDGPVDEASPVTVTVTASDVAGTNDPLSYEFDFDNDGTYEVGPQASNQASHTYMDDGLYSVNVRVTDGDGGSATGTTTVTVNNVSPTLVAIENQTMNEGGTLTVSLQAHDPGADTLRYFYITTPHNSFTALTDNGDGTGELVFTPGYTDAGTYSVIVTVTDDDGGSTSATFTLTVNDPVTPVSTHAIDPAPNAAGWNNTDPITVNITATDDGGTGTVASIHYILDDGSEVTVPGSSASVSVSGEGTHTVEYWAVDDAGNVEIPHNTAAVKIDTIPPVVAVTGGPSPAWPPDFVSSLTSGSGQISDPGGSGVDEDSCEYKIDSSGWLSWPIPDGAISTDLGTLLAAAGVSGDGQHMLYGRVRDIAGNEFSGSASFKLDDTAPDDPAVVSTSHTVGVWSNDDTIGFEWSGASDGSGSGVAGYSFMVDTNPSTMPNTTIDLAHGTDPHTWTSGALPDGDSYYFHLRTVDHLGNWSGTVHLGPFKIDTESPQITCPGDITQGNDPGQCNAVVTWPAPTATDNTGVASVSCIPASGSTFPVGVTTVTCTAADLAGNTAQCSFNVTVIDTENPVISGCPSDITVNNDPGICGAAVSWTEPTASDNCGIDTFSSDRHPGDTFPVGTTTVTYTATDIHGNSTSCSFDVTVVDAEPPATTLTVVPPDPDNVAAPTFDWSASDNNGCTASSRLVYSYRVDTGAWSAWFGSPYVTTPPLVEGTHTFEVRAMDESGNIGDPASYTWLIDLTPPVVTITTPVDRADYNLAEEVLAEWTAADVPSGLASTVGTTSTGSLIDTAAPGYHDFTVTATDLAGNSTVVTVTYRVVYEVAPGGVAGGGGGVEPGEGGFLDKSIAGGGGEVGLAPLEAIYNVGDVIYASFILTDNDGNPVTNAISTCTLVHVTFSDDKEIYAILNLFVFTSDGETGLYWLEIPTKTEESELEPGIYDLWLGFDDGTQTRLRIQLLPPEEG